MFNRLLWVDAALKTMPSIGREVKSARPPCHRFGPPKSRFDDHVACGIGHGRGLSAHDSRERLHALRIGNDADLFINHDGAAIEQFQRFAGTPPTHDELVVDFVEIEDVRRSAVLEHHVVGDVDQCRDAALTATCQAIDHPCRRLGLRVHVAYDATRESATQIMGLNVDGQALRVGHGATGNDRREQRRTGQCGHFARNAVDTQAVRKIGRELEDKKHVVKLECVAKVHAHGRISGKFHQTTMVLCDLEFARGTQHARAVDAAQFAHANANNLTVVAGG